jgi:hypothetical protein
MTFGHLKSMKKAIKELPEEMTFTQQQETFFNLQLKLYRSVYIKQTDLEQVKKLEKQSEDFLKSVPHPNRKYLILQTGYALIFVIHELLDIDKKEAIVNLIAVCGGLILEYEVNSLLYEYLEQGNIDGAKRLLKKLIEIQQTGIKSPENLEKLKLLSDAVKNKWETLDDDTKEITSDFLDHTDPLVAILESGEDVDCWKDFFSQLHDRKDIESHIMEG